MKLEYAKKLLVDKKLTYEDLHIIQSALPLGYCVQGKTVRHLEFLFIDQSNKAWILAIKAARSGGEIWFCTLFFTTDDGYYVKKFHKSPLLRDRVIPPFAIEI